MTTQQQTTRPCLKTAESEDMHPTLTSGTCTTAHAYPHSQTCTHIHISYTHIIHIFAKKEGIEREKGKGKGMGS